MPEILFKKYPKTKQVYTYLKTKADVQGVVIANPKKIHKSLHIFKHTAKKSIKLLYHSRLINAVDVSNHAYVIPDLVTKFKNMMAKKAPVLHYQSLAKKSIALAKRSGKDTKKVIQIDKLRKAKVKHLLDVQHDQHNQIQVLKVNLPKINEMKKRLLRQRRSNYNRVRRMKYRLKKRTKAQRRKARKLTKANQQIKAKQKQINQLNHIIDGKNSAIKLYQTGGVNQYFNLDNPGKIDIPFTHKKATKKIKPTKSNQKNSKALSAVSSNQYFAI